MVVCKNRNSCRRKHCLHKMKHTDIDCKDIKERNLSVFNSCSQCITEFEYEMKKVIGEYNGNM